MTDTKLDKVVQKLIMGALAGALSIGLSDA